MTAPAPSSGLLAPGDRIAGKYEIVRIVGEGGMGVVYEVVHTRLQQRAAIKMLLPRVQMMGEVVARFEREARAACRLRSRYAVRIQDVDQDNGRAYMVMEYLEGHDLSQELHARTKLAIGEAVDVILMACAAMAEAHASGVVHRDLKPSNLFLVREGGKRIVKVLDFGISKIQSDAEANVTSTFATMGTPLYMSPEQIRSAKNVDGRTDIWSLGVILFEALAGVRPFQGTTTAAAAAIVADPPPVLREIVPEVPEGLERAVMTALAKKPEERFADVKGFAEAIAPFGTSGDRLAEVIEAAAPRAVPSLQPVRQQSTPSFAHAPTVAHPTPPVSKQVSPMAASIAEKHPSGANAASAPSTQGAWTERSATRAGRATRVWAVLAVSAAVGTVAGVVIARSHAREAAVAPAEPIAPTIVPAVTAPASASASASASAPASASASASASPPATASPSPRTLPRTKPRPVAPPPSPAAPPATHAPAAPAATNPVHL